MLICNELDIEHAIDNGSSIMIHSIKKDAIISSSLSVTSPYFSIN